MTMAKPIHCAWLWLVTISMTMAADPFTMVDLRDDFDNDGISFSTNLGDGEFDYQQSYPAEDMPRPGRIELEGVPFEFPRYDDGWQNCVRLRDKTIDLINTPAATIYFLGASFRNKPAQATIYYTDGSRERQLVLLGDAGSGSLQVYKTKTRYVSNRIRDDGGWPLYIAAVYPQQSKPIDAIGFGDDHRGAVLFDDQHSMAQTFAITTSSEPPQGELAEKLPPFGIATLDWGSGRRGTNQAQVQIIAAAGFTGPLHIQWQCGQQKKSHTTLVMRGESASSKFDFDLEDSNTISLSITDGQERTIAFSKHVSFQPPLVVRTERLIVLDDSAPLDAEILINVESQTLGEHRLEVELVEQDENHDGELIASRAIDPLQRKRHHVQFSAAETPRGRYKIYARLIRQGEPVAKNSTRPILRRERPSGGIRKVRFDTDGMMLVDGKRTFTIGMLANFGVDDIPEFKQTGMNCVLAGSPTMGQGVDLWKLLDEAYQSGIMVVGGAFHERDQFFVRRSINLQREHPAIIGYHFLEEPGSRSDIDAILQSYMTIRRMDANHFVDLIDWSESAYWRYEPFADVIVPDRYSRGPKPTPNIAQSSLQQIRQARAACQDRKPVWFMPQMFSFLVESRMGITKDPTVPEGPTPEQVRLSGYSGIVGGAKGILFYEYSSAKNGNSGNWGGKSLWDASKHVLTEISQLRPVLETVGPSQTVKATTGIETWAKQHAGYWYVIAVNTTEKPLQAQIDLNELEVSEPPVVLFENGRTCQFSAGKITDDFRADGVHVYKITKQVKISR